MKSSEGVPQTENNRSITCFLRSSQKTHQSQPDQQHILIQRSGDQQKLSSFNVRTKSQKCAKPYNPVFLNKPNQNVLAAFYENSTNEVNGENEYAALKPREFQYQNKYKPHLASQILLPLAQRLDANSSIESQMSKNSGRFSKQKNGTIQVFRQSTSGLKNAHAASTDSLAKQYKTESKLMKEEIMQSMTSMRQLEHQSKEYSQLKMSTMEMPPEVIDQRKIDSSIKKPVSSSKSYRIPTVSKKKNTDRSNLQQQSLQQTMYGKESMKIQEYLAVQQISMFNSEQSTRHGQKSNTTRKSVEQAGTFQKSNNIKYNLFKKKNCQVEANIRVFEKNSVDTDDVIVKMGIEPEEDLEMSHMIYDGEQRPPSQTVQFGQLSSQLYQKQNALNFSMTTKTNSRNQFWVKPKSSSLQSRATMRSKLQHLQPLKTQESMPVIQAQLQSKERLPLFSQQSQRVKLSQSMQGQLKSSFPLPQDIVVFHQNKQLTSKETTLNFHKQVDQITTNDNEVLKENMLMYVDKSKIPNINQRINQISTEHQEKVAQCDKMLTGLMTQIKYEFMNKGMSSQPRDVIEQQIINTTRQRERAVREKSKAQSSHGNRQPYKSCLPKTSLNRRQTGVTGRVPNDFEIRATQYDKKKDKQENRSYRDHSDNYITHTGHLIKDHALVKKTSNGRNTAAEMIEMQNGERNHLKNLIKKQLSRPISRQEILNQLRSAGPHHFDYEKFNKDRRNRLYHEIANQRLSPSHYNRGLQKHSREDLAIMTESEQSDVYERKITTALRRVANSDDISVDISDEENQEQEVTIAARIEHLNDKGADFEITNNLQKQIISKNFQENKGSDSFNHLIVNDQQISNVDKLLSILEKDEIKYIDINNCKITATNTLKITQHLQKMRLFHLSIKGVQMTKAFIPNLNYICSLNLSYNNFGTRGAEIILKGILDSNIKFLDLSYNTMKSKECQDLLEDLIQQNWALMDMNISFCDLPDVLSIVNKIKDYNMSLQVVHMDGLFKSDDQLTESCNIFGIKLANTQDLEIDLHQSFEIQPNAFSKLGYLKFGKTIRRQNLKDSAQFQQPDIQDVDKLPTKSTFNPIGFTQMDSKKVFTRFLGRNDLKGFTNSISDFQSLWNPFTQKSEWTLNSLCHQCNNLRYCVILKQSNQPVVVKVSNKFYRMKSMDLFLKENLGIKHFSNWLDHLEDELDKYHPYYIMAPGKQTYGQCNSTNGWQILPIYIQTTTKQQIQFIQFFEDHRIMKQEQWILPRRAKQMNNILFGFSCNDPKGKLANLEELPDKEMTPQMTLLKEIMNMQDSQMRILKKIDPEDHEKLVVDCVETDYRASKMTAVVEAESLDQMQAVWEILESYQHHITSIYHYLVSQQSLYEEKLYPKISKRVIQEFLAKHRILENYEDFDVLDDILFKSLQSRLQMKRSNSVIKGGEGSSSFTGGTPRQSQCLTTHNLAGALAGMVSQKGREPGFKRYQLLEIFCRLAFYKNKKPSKQTKLIIQDFFHEKINPLWCCGENISTIRNDFIFTPQNDRIFLMHQPTMTKMIDQIGTSTLEHPVIPLLNLISFFKGELVEVQESSFSVDPDYNQPDSIQHHVLTEQQIFTCFAMSKKFMIDDQNDDKISQRIDKTLASIQEKQAITIHIKDQKQNSAEMFTYENAYPKTSEFHQLKCQEFNEFLIRLASVVMHPNLPFGNSLHEPHSECHFYYLDRFLRVIEKNLL